MGLLAMRMNLIPTATSYHLTGRLGGLPARTPTLTSSTRFLMTTCWDMFLFHSSRRQNILNSRQQDISILRLGAIQASSSLRKTVSEFGLSVIPDSVSHLSYSLW